jgi:hypothetical protein
MVLEIRKLVGAKYESYVVQKGANFDPKYSAPMAKRTEFLLVFASEPRRKEGHHRSL